MGEKRRKNKYIDDNDDSSSSASQSPRRSVQSSRNDTIQKLQANHDKQSKRRRRKGSKRPQESEGTSTGLFLPFIRAEDDDDATCSKKKKKMAKQRKSSFRDGREEDQRGNSLEELNRLVQQQSFEAFRVANNKNKNVGIKDVYEQLSRQKHAVVLDTIPSNRKKTHGSKLRRGDESGSKKVRKNKVDLMTQLMQEEMLKNIGGEKKLHKKLKFDGKRAIEQLPVDFLNSLKLKDYVMERGAATITKIFNRIIHAQTSAALIQWKALVEQKREEGQQEKMQKYVQAKGFQNMQRIYNRIMKAQLMSGLVKWLEITVHQRKMERVAATIEIQRIARGYFGKLEGMARQVEKRRKLERDSAAKIQRMVRVYQARHISRRLKRKRLENVATYVIQQFFRVVVAKSRFRRRMNQIILERKQNDAAITINRVARGHLGRNVWRQLDQERRRQLSAVTIQCLWRKHLACEVARQKRIHIMEAAFDEVLVCVESAERQVAAFKIQTAYAQYRQNAMEQSAALVAIEAVLNAERHVAALVIQNQFRETQVQRLVKNIKREVDELILKSTVTIQTIARGRLARKTLAELRMEERAKRIAAIKLQAARRGQVGRASAVKRKTEVKNLVSKIEEARWRQMKRRIGKRVFHRFNNRRSILLSKIFATWRDVTRESIYVREVEKTRAAVQYLHHNLLTRSFRGWESRVQERKANREKVRMALNFVRNKLIAKVFLSWKDCVSEKQYFKEALVRVFLMCIPLKYYNSQRQRVLVKLAIGVHDSKLQGMGFDAMKRLFNHRRNQTVRAAEFYQERWKKRTPELVVQSWKNFVVHRKILRAKLIQAETHHHNTLVKKAVNGWKAYLVYLIDMREKFALAKSHHLKSWQRSMLARWIQMVGDSKEYRRKFELAIAHDIRNQLQKSLVTWLVAVKEAREKKEKWNKACQHYRQTLLRVVLEELYCASHEELLRRQGEAATTIQTQWRIRLAKLERFKRWSRKQYELDQERKRMLEEQRLKFIQDRQIQNTTDSYQGLEEFIRTNSLDGDRNRLILVLFTAPWVPKRSLYNVESTVALSTIRATEDQWTSVKVCVETIGYDKCIAFGVRSVPCVIPVWRGRPNLASAPSKYWSKVVDRVANSLQKIPIAKFSCNEKGFVQDDKAENARVNNLTINLGKAIRAGLTETTNAAKVIQTLFRDVKSTQLVKAWREASKKLVQNHHFEKDKNHWESKNCFAYQVDNNNKEQDAKVKEFFFDHERCECDWTVPLPEKEKSVSLVVVMSTGHRYRIENLKRASKLLDVLNQIANLRSTDFRFLGVALRSESVWFDHSIITSKYNLDVHAKIGAGITCLVRRAALEMEDDLETAQAPETNEDEPEINIQGGKSENDGEQHPLKEDENGEDSKTESESKRKVEWLKCKVTKVHTDESVDLVLLEQENEVESIHMEIPRDQLKLCDLSDQVDKTLDDLGIHDQSVLEVYERSDQQEDLTEDLEKVLHDHGLLCALCKETTATHFCKDCDCIFCPTCFLDKHLVRKPLVKLGFTPDETKAKRSKVDEENVEPADDFDQQEEELDGEVSISEFDMYMLKRSLNKHKFVMMDAVELSQAFAEEREAELKRQGSSSVISLNSGSGKSFARRQNNKLIVCSDCRVRRMSRLCKQCDENFCDHCFLHFHDTGNKRDHEWTEFDDKKSSAVLKKKESIVANRDLIKSRGWITRDILREQQEAKEEQERIREADLKAAEEIIKEAFQKYDSDGSGHLDAKELASFLRYEICEPVTEEELEQAITEMDTDGNGTIEYEELLSWFVDLNKKEGRDSAKMRVLRMNLLAKKRARMLKDQMTLLLPQQKLENTRKFLEEQAKAWQNRRPAVPGYPHRRQLRVSDFESHLFLFQRFIHREFEIFTNLLDKPNQPPMSDEKRERVRIAFQSIFVPVYNEGKLSKVYYNDGIELTHGEEIYRQEWSEDDNCFYYTNLRTGKKLDTNPILMEKHEKFVRESFNKYDKDGSGYLDRREVKRLLETELCIKLSKKNLAKAQKAMDNDENGRISFKEFIRWYTSGIDTGEHDVSYELRAKQQLRKLRETGQSVRKDLLNKGTTVGRSIVSKTLDSAQAIKNNVKSLGKGPLYKKLLDEGWKEADLDKAFNRCPASEDTAETEKTIREWLDQNAIHKPLFFLRDE